MAGPDAISPLARYAALVAEVPVIRLAEPDARALGLREGQIVQALVQSQGDSLYFDLGGKRFEFPAAAFRAMPGDLRWFRINRQGDSFVFKPLPSAPGASGALTGVSSGEGGNALPGAVDSGLMASRASAVSSSSPRIAALLAQPPGFASLAQVLSPGRLESALIEAGATELARALISLRLRSDSISSHDIQRAVAQGGMWSEAMLASGRQLGQVDLKALLRQIGRVLGSRSSASAAEVDDAVDDIERKQIDSLQQSVDGRMVFSVMLPFADAPAASLRFERGSRQDERGNGGYTIDLHVAPPRLGDLWMKTTVVGTQVDVTVWAVRPSVARLVSAAASDLGVDLGEAGLSLRAFNVLEGQRPELAPSVDRPATGGLDLSA